VTVGLSGCQLLTSTADIAGSVIFASDSVASMQTELGPFSSNQYALEQLTILREEIQVTLTTGANALDIEQYQARAWVLYETFKNEVKQRSGELTAQQLIDLGALDVELVELNTKINDFKESSTFDNDVLHMVYQATVLMSYYYGI
jgi:hypothetical protein